MEFIRLSEVNVREQVGNRIYLTALVKNVEFRPMKNGGESMLCVAYDKDIERECRSFEVTDTLKERMKVNEGKLFQIIVDVKPYDKSEDGVSCIIHEIRVYNGDMSENDFINSVDNMQGYICGVISWLDSINDTLYGRIARYILQKHWEKFCRYPAASSMHHNAVGGLVMHTYSVVSSCISLYNIYSGIYGADFANYELLIAAALIHDIGKCSEYDVGVTGETKYSTHAVLSTHIMDGMLEIKEAVTMLGCDGATEAEELVHCVAAHHGQKDWGSPVEPAMIEARILHMADNLDAEMWRFIKTSSKLVAGEAKTEWIGGRLVNTYRGIGREAAQNNMQIYDVGYREVSNENEETTEEVFGWQ